MDQSTNTAVSLALTRLPCRGKEPIPDSFITHDLLHCAVGLGGAGPP